MTVQLDLFRPYVPPHEAWWDEWYDGWRPQVGATCRLNGLVYYHDRSIYPHRLSENFRVGRIVALHDDHAEVIVPLLSDAPWADQRHYTVPFIFKSLGPEIGWGFDEAAFWAKNPLKND